MEKKSNISILVVLYITAFIASFNENIVNTGLVDVMSWASVSDTTAQWLVTGYMIVTAIIVVMMAFLYRKFSVRTLFYIAASFLAAGLVLAYFAPSFPILICARLIQSIGTGIFIPTMMNSVMRFAPREKTGTYLAIGSAMITLGPAFSPLVSGFMVTYFGWRSVYLIPFVIIMILSVVAYFLVRDDVQTENVSIDLASVFVASLALVLFTCGINLMTTQTLIACLLLVAGIIFFFVFVKRQNALEDPLLNLRPFKEGSFGRMAILVFISMLMSFSMTVLLPLYYQNVFALTAFASGALILIPLIGNSVAALFAGRVMDKFGGKILIPAGFLAIACGLIGGALFGAAENLVPVVVSTFVVFVGISCTLATSQTEGLRNLSPSLTPHGVSAMNVAVQTAACIGPVLFIGVLSDVSASCVANSQAFASAQASGFSSAVYIAAAIAFVGFLVAIWNFWFAKSR